MKKYLIRAGLSPFDNFSPDYVFDNSRILGNNSGNMLYAYSVWRALSVEDCTLVPTYYKYNYTDSEIAEINETYDAFIIPLANAFRKSFQKEMSGLTEMIRKLTIPVYVIGVGVDAPYEPELDKKNSFDETVKEFVTAVLEKSSIIGVRGEITSEYLKRLGFTEEKHMTPIGCPSMYTYGDKIEIRKTVINKDSAVAFNHSTKAPGNIVNFVKRTMNQFDNHYMILQTKKEYDLVYAGASYMYHSEADYPCRIMTDKIYMDDRIRFFINIPSWYEFMKEQDFCFGPRLHGNIAATINGTPSIILPKDARMRELTDYHNLTCVWPDQINENSNMMDFIEKADFDAPCKVQKRNFDHFVDFLNINGIDHIYKNTCNPTNTYFDRLSQEIVYEPGVGTVFGCTKEEMAQRQNRYFEQTWNKMREMEQEKKELIKENKKLLNGDGRKMIEDLQKKVKEQEKLLNRRSVKIALDVSRRVKKIMK